MRFKKKKAELTEEQKEEIRIKDFFDRILPSTIRFYTDHYIIGDSYRCVWAIKEYPPTTEELALFSQLADRNNVTVRLYSRLVDGLEQRKIIQNAARRNKLHTGSDDALENIKAETQRVTGRHHYGTDPFQDERRQADFKTKRGIPFCLTRRLQYVQRTV